MAKKYDNILLIGLGGVGYYLAKRLAHEGHAITAIESNPDLIRRADGGHPAAASPTCNIAKPAIKARNHRFCIINASVGENIQSASRELTDARVF